MHRPANLAEKGLLSSQSFAVTIWSNLVSTSPFNCALSHWSSLESIFFYQTPRFVLYQSLSQENLYLKTVFAPRGKQNEFLSSKTLSSTSSSYYALWNKSRRWRWRRLLQVLRCGSEIFVYWQWLQFPPSRQAQVAITGSSLQLKCDILRDGAQCRYGELEDPLKFAAEMWRIARRRTM